ncbi:MAG: thiolase family protein [Syntrophobacteraceae bacterium]|jgi:acetyl-CoA acetyltransferase
MEKVNIIAGGMTKFGRHIDRSLKSLVEEAVNAALLAAGLSKDQVGAVWVGNASQGVLSGQESIRGQVVMRAMGIGGVPVINVENACASSATALYGARNMVALGECEVALVVGMEKMYFDDRSRALAAFKGCTDVEILPSLLEDFANEEEIVRRQSGLSGEQEKVSVEQRSIFMDIYARWSREHMEKYGTTQRQLAAIASKNHFHSSMNPLAQYQKAFTVEEVLNSPEIVYPLTRLMCSPIGDGAAALLICSDNFAKRQRNSKPVEIAATVMASGEDPAQETVKGKTLARTAQKAYERAGIGPEDVSLAEVHDATAFGELSVIESLGFCLPGEGGPFSESGNTSLGGKIPVNVSGGLESQGHPIGATGVRQVVELYWHLTKDPRVRLRQVDGATVGLAENGGGMINSTEGAISITILKS